MTATTATPRDIRRLIFLYNADSGRLNALVDSAKKLLMINGCSLCAITHGLAGEKREWKECKEEIGVPVDYVHRDEVTPALRDVVRERYPSVVAEAADGSLVLLLDAEVLDRAKGTVADLKGRLKTYASMNGLRFPDTVGIGA